MPHYVCTRSNAKPNIVRAQIEKYTGERDRERWDRREMKKQRTESALLFFSRTVMKYCSSSTVPLHAEFGRSRLLGDSRFLTRDENKMSATLWAGLFVLCAWTTNPLPVRTHGASTQAPPTDAPLATAVLSLSGHMVRRGCPRAGTIATAPCLGATA